MKIIFTQFITGLSQTLKTRVPEEVKKELAEVAIEEGLDLSDIVRRALVQFIASRKHRKTAHVAA